MAAGATMAVAVNLQSIKLPNLAAQKKRINEQQLRTLIMLPDERARAHTHQLDAMMKNEMSPGECASVCVCERETINNMNTS